MGNLLFWRGRDTCLMQNFLSVMGFWGEILWVFFFGGGGNSSSIGLYKTLDSNAVIGHSCSSEYWRSFSRNLGKWPVHVHLMQVFFFIYLAVIMFYSIYY